MIDSVSHVEEPLLKYSAIVAFIGAADLVRARDFYEGVLGLEIVSMDEFALQARAGGVALRIARTSVVAAAPYTVLGFEVTDIGALAGALAAKGVVFERYPSLSDTQDSRGIWTAPSGTQVAWFKDPDGNLLSISETRG